MVGQHAAGLQNDRHEEGVLALHLKGRTFKVYQQLSEKDKKDTECIEYVLIKVFGTDLFVNWVLLPGKMPEEFLAELQQLTQLVRKVLPEEWIRCRITRVRTQASLGIYQNNSPPKKYTNQEATSSLEALW